MLRRLLVCLVLTACTPTAKAPTPIEAATAAINLTDEALAAAIEVAPAGDLPEWTRRVVLLEQAAAVVRVGGKACDVLPDVALVASLIKCAKCGALVRTASEVLSCKP